MKVYFSVVQNVFKLVQVFFEVVQFSYYVFEVFGFFGYQFLYVVLYVIDLLQICFYGLIFFNFIVKFLVFDIYEIQDEFLDVYFFV